jgi:hypothetical protein
MPLLLRKKDWTKDERRIVNLLLQGETEFLECLRRQISLPFFLWVRRRSPKTKQRFYRTSPNEYTIDIVFDGSFQEKFSAGYDISLDIDDLTIVETRLKQDLRVVGVIYHGILTSIRFFSDEPVKWPKYLQLEDWSFWSEGKPAKKRLSFEKLDILLQRVQVSDLKESWVKELLVHADQQGLRVGVRPPADPTFVPNLEREIGAKLPVDFGEFLDATNGVGIGSGSIFGCDQLYVLDAEGLPSDLLLVFAMDKFGNPVTLDLSQVRDDVELCPVIFLNHDTGEVIAAAESFKEWLTKSIDALLEGK